ncbi:MAG: type II toxin-antitoxin system PrlF family antitoxin [candidate division KSB1 bacterium]|nr:type II toxin-antitoxin system PrlF family antitoxin [candidate division KSB1 bacterium]MDQ7066227.1 type II toxin-antitoxin system PrlF family antitoxin [candidate division KSB1 bacterium]
MKNSAISTVTSKGQVTLPRSIREKLNIKPGDKVEFWIGPDGQVRLVPINISITELKGLLAYSGPKKTIEEMQEAIEKGDSAE